ncbi:MFS transporter, partial [Lysobacter sp. 2RAB21]
LGPTVGGWLTDVAGWRWIFYINIVPGIAVTALSLSLIRVDHANLPMLKRIDYSHLLAMAVFLGGLQYVLEEGPRHEWFEYDGIDMAAWFSLEAYGMILERS